MKKKSLAEMVATAKNTKFSLPPDVTCKKQLLSNGRYGYVFRHDELGALGRILVLPHEGGQTHLSCEVTGDADDPMTEKRRDILEPIAEGILADMAKICGDGTGEPKSYISPKEQHLVKSMVYPCDVCKKITAMIVFAPDAETKGQLEDYARMMYAKIQEFNVPTWIVGAETENIVNGEDLRKSLVLKIHPSREEARIMTPDEVMNTVDNLMATHCKNKWAKKC